MDKVIHFFEYGLLSFLASQAFRTLDYKILQKLSLFCGAMFAIIFGISDEFHQYFVPGRCASFFDLLADACGAISVQIGRHLLKR
jgi:VanZ family protein